MNQDQFTKLIDAQKKAGRPTHRHTCPEGDHEWECSSPYCDDLLRFCLTHGGDEPRGVAK